MTTTDSTTTPARDPVTVPALVRQSCAHCDRDGQLVCQSVQPKPAYSNPAKYPFDPAGPWVFRMYLCRWHRAAWNRNRMDCQRKMTVLEYADDATLLANTTNQTSSGAR
jgi:hypothetical protein